MSLIRHIVEPSKLVLSWQPPEGTRSRYAVGEIHKTAGGILFRYLIATPAFETARSAGFRGYPAFSLEQAEHSSNVLETFLTRVPSRSRADFSDFLKHHRLPIGTTISDLALLGYTGAKLPSDAFELVPIFEDTFAELELVLEACGFRHQGVDLAMVQPGKCVDFLPEPHNQHDPHAVAMATGGQKIGYVNRILSPAFSYWLRQRPIAGQIDRINGRSERPLVYVFTEIGPPILVEAS